MKSESVSFYSSGALVHAIWRTPDRSPDHSGERLRSVVQGPGWMGLKDAKLYERYHEALTAAGFGVLVFDYRGFGDSEGDPSVLSPAHQLEDLGNAVTYLSTRDDVDADAIGVFGSGGTGGGNAVLLAGIDRRIRAAVCQNPVADGEDWLHRMRSEHEWLAFLGRLDDDRRRRVTTGKRTLVHPREEIMVPTPERRATSVKADVDDRVPSAVGLEAADEIVRYRPIDAAATLRTPLLVIGVEDDATTPTDHAERLFHAALGPKELVIQRHTTHYAAYDAYWKSVTPRIVAWFDRYLVGADIVVRSSPSGTEQITYLEAP